MALPLPLVSEKGKAALSAHLHEVVEEKNSPAMWFGATNAKEEIYFDSAGERVYGQPDKGELFSTTKLVTTIAALQQVERGRISLDDSEALYKVCPELGRLHILEGYDDDGKEILKQPKNKITLRMLVNHTSGLTYPWNAPQIARWVQEHHTPQMFAPNTPIEAFIFPLAFEPGSRFRYSIGIDWAGIMVHRLTGQTLEEYFKENIWSPCGIQGISFHPADNYEDVAMTMTVRTPFHTGKVKVMEGPAMGRNMDSKTIGPNYMGGGGLFGPARDYLRFLKGLLASAEPGSKGIISAETFKLLFTDSIPDSAEIRADIAKMAHDQHIHDPDVLTNGTGDHIGYGPALFINKIPSKYGRKAMSGFWDGAAKTYYWLDPSTGIAAICFTNILSHNPDPFNQVYNKFERILYDNLEQI